jgi:GntR family transcriptional regulator
MEFNKDKAIFLQIADSLFEAILARKWQEESRIPSVRDMAIAMEVNPNTIIRTYAFLQEKEIIYNRRGIGYFIASEAIKRVISLKKEVFIKADLPKLIKTMKLLDISFEELKKLCKNSLQSSS